MNPLMGKGNVVVSTCDYDSYEEMKKEQDRFGSDPECMKALRACAQWEVQGSAESEILEAATPVA
jgi:hypothetical protein